MFLWLSLDNSFLSAYAGVQYCLDIFSCWTVLGRALMTRKGSGGEEWKGRNGEEGMEGEKVGMEGEE